LPLEVILELFYLSFLLFEVLKFSEEFIFRLWLIVFAFFRFLQVRFLGKEGEGELAIIYLCLVFLAPFYFIFLLLGYQSDSFKDIGDVVYTPLLHLEFFHGKI